MLRLLVGLGNPGFQFNHTRHNAGFNVVSTYALAHDATLRKLLFRSCAVASIRTSVSQIVVALPLTFMNGSGRVIPSLLRRARAVPGQMLVVCDNMDLPVGAIRVKQRGTTRAHNGLSSIMDVLGTGDFPRLYVGVGRPLQYADIVSHVLSRPTPEEQADHDRAIARAVEAIVMLETQDFGAVANVINRRE